jgi:hypothetical protein
MSRPGKWPAGHRPSFLAGSPRDRDLLKLRKGPRPLRIAHPGDRDPLKRVGEPVELLEPWIGVVLPVLGVTGDLDGDDVLGGVLTPVGAECGTEHPGADEGAPLLVLAPARQLPLGEQPLIFRGLLGTDVDDDDVQLTHGGGSFGCPCADLGGRSRRGSIRAGQHAAISPEERDPPFGVAVRIADASASPLPDRRSGG